MAVIASIDGPLRRIYLHADTVGVTVHPIDIYKEMRTLRRVDESLRKFDLFMEASGNIPKGNGKFTERIVTLLFGTRIVPFDVSYELTINGTIITDEGTEGIDCFDRSSLSATTVVDINYVPPQVEVIVISPESGLTPVQSDQLEFVHGQVARTVYVNTESVLNGVGYQQDPFNNWSDAVDSAEALGLARLELLADAVIDRQLKNFEITGVGFPTVDCNGQLLDNSIFTRVRLSGVHTGYIQARECSLFSLLNASGVFKECVVFDTLQPAISGKGTVLWHCIPAFPLQSWTLDMSLVGDKYVSVNNHSGAFVVSNMTRSGDVLQLQDCNGTITIDASCTSGSIYVSGVVEVINNSTIPLLNLDATAGILPWNQLTGSITKTNSMGKYILTKLLSFKQFIGLK